jgi:hypothetical protein
MLCDPTGLLLVAWVLLLQSISCLVQESRQLGLGCAVVIRTAQGSGGANQTAAL